MLKETILRAFDALPFSLRHELFYRSGRSLGVESYTITGKAGSFAGPMSDQTIMTHYMRTGRLWSQECVLGILNGFFRDSSGTLLDVGANIGIVTIPMANAGVSVMAFEPDELNCALLKANIARNCKPDARIDVVKKAVYRKTTTLRFARSTYNCGDHHLDAAGEYEVEAIALDEMARPMGKFAIKIDTQGAEPGIFEGGQKTIEAAGMVLSEFWPAGIARMGDTPDAILETVRLAPHGRLVHVEPGPWISGTDLTDQLWGIARAKESVDHRNGVDFVIARERF